MPDEENEFQRRRAEQLKDQKRALLEKKRSEALADAEHCESEAAHLESVLSGPHDPDLEGQTKIGLRNFKAMAVKKRAEVADIDKQLNEL